MERTAIEQHRVQRVLLKQEHSCGACGEELKAGTTVDLIQIVRPYRQYVEEAQQWVIHFAKELDEETKDFDSFPYFFHENCFAETYEELKEMMEDTPPYTIGDHICTCNVCGSHIAEGDLMGVAHSGTFQLSERQPDGNDAVEYHFDPVNPVYICLNCINELNINVIEGLWDEDGTIATAVREGEKQWASE